MRVLSVVGTRPNLMKTAPVIEALERRGVEQLLTDSVSELLFIHSPEARENLLRDGRPEGSIHYVGNTMIDSLVAMRERFVAPASNGHLLVTLHRPALVDGPLLAAAVRRLNELEMPIVFPLHPRTRAAMASQDLQVRGMTEPVGYLEFLGLVSAAAAVLTDSGGIQEETTYLGVPCFTLRDNTERPVTVEMGTNVLLGLKPERIAELPALIDATRARDTRVPPYWDGAAAARLADVVVSHAPIRRRS